MVIKHTNITNKYFFIAFAIFVNLFCIKLTNAISDDMRTYRDSGVIGEKKTTKEAKIYRDKITGATYQFHKHGTFVTPRVVGDTAYFNLSYDYAFYLKCLNWKYTLKAYWFSGNVGEERIGFSVNLASPDKKTFIDVKEIDVPVNSSLAPLLTQEQLNILKSQSYVEDPFVGNERVLASQQAVKWILDKGLDGYGVMNDKSIKFTLDHAGDKEFVRTEIDVFSKKENITKKYVVWALNLRGYRLKRDEKVRRMYTLLCQVTTDSSNYLSSVANAQMILETLNLTPAKKMFQ